MGHNPTVLFSSEPNGSFLLLATNLVLPRKVSCNSVVCDPEYDRVFQNELHSVLVTIPNNKDMKESRICDNMTIV